MPKGPAQAVDYIFSTNKYSSKSQDAINNIKSKFEENASAFGKYTGYELINTQAAGKDLQLLTFIVKHDRLPLVFKMLFYRPQDTWVIQNFSFVTDLDDVFKSGRPSN